MGQRETSERLLQSEEASVGDGAKGKASTAIKRALIFGESLRK